LIHPSTAEFIMSFDLRITFTGMCLFVPDPRDATSRMHVVLPAAGKHPHDARLLFDGAYVLGASELTRTLECRVLDRQAVRLLQPSGGAALDLPGEIVDLQQTLGKRVAPNKLVETPPPVVKSRITLAGGAVTDYEYGAAFDMPYHKGIPMTWQVEWTVRGIADSALKWELVSLDTAVVTEVLPPLVPIGGVVHVFVYHVITDELPGANPAPVVIVPNVGDPADHFAAFFDVATGGIDGIPEFSSELFLTTTCAAPDAEASPPENGPHATHSHGTAAAFAAEAWSPDAANAPTGDDAEPSSSPDDETERGGSPFTCMTATAPIG
jgi:hypothetical protein